ncbi:unnamed protein product [Rotaria sp. Silwood2]|nr:unnamed protein product [Rotaria sp. Silwood2]CAF3194520.1 unnamed protein product [Rotaria sp. Silwood2]CAF3981358.1 unnamed protein product [Rotaria sp. Silwood2]CAF4452204.1 unnamed protein product [Rotaria sp. Silwood2]
MLYWQIQRDFLSLFSRDDFTKGYFDPIDGLRAIANLLIISCHLVTIFGAFVPSYPHVQWQEFLNSQAFILAPLMTLALEIFFMLSAFLLTHKLIIQWTKDDNSHRLFLQQYPKSILKRALRFWPGILLATIIMFICGESRNLNPANYVLYRATLVQQFKLCNSLVPQQFLDPENHMLNYSELALQYVSMFIRSTNNIYQSLEHLSDFGRFFFSFI